MKKALKFVFGNDPKSTLIGYAVGVAQLIAGGNNWKNALVASGLALLGRVTNELQAKFPIKQ